MVTDGLRMDGHPLKILDFRGLSELWMQYLDLNFYYFPQGKGRYVFVFVFAFLFFYGVIELF